LEGSAVVPPTKVCPHCGAQAQTFEAKCPHCKKKYKRRRGRGVTKGCLSVVLGGLVLIVIVTVIIAAGVNQANNEHKATGIAPAQFAHERLGRSQSQVEADLGKPDNSQQFTSRGVFTKAPENSSCIYYHEKGYALFEGKSYQLCFENGKLSDKNSY
jgi:hypothetical protein